MEKVVELKNKYLNKVFIIYTKYSPHLLALVYFIYTMLNFCGIDWNLIGCFFHVSLFVWIQLLFTSFRFKYCYVHRLPIYYIGLNESITSLDYYIGIPVNIINLLIIHLLLISILIFGYSYYYIKFKLK